MPVAAVVPAKSLDTEWHSLYVAHAGTTEGPLLLYQEPALEQLGRFVTTAVANYQLLYSVNVAKSSGTCSTVQQQGHSSSSTKHISNRRSNGSYYCYVLLVVLLLGSSDVEFG